MARSVLVGTMALPALITSACGGDGDEDDSERPLEDGDPDACERDCDRQVAAGCANTPPNYGEGCRAICQYARTTTPAECQAKLRAQYQCALEFITYSCEGANLAVHPQGGCAPEASACANCTGTICGLPDLG